VRRLDLVQWVDLHSSVDPRGSLTAIEGGQTIPFSIQRVYFMHGLTSDRGGHAHRDTQQLLIAAAGSCTTTLSDGREERRYECNNPGRGLYIAPMLFIRLSRFSADAVVLVLASTRYDRSRSIRSWDEYLEAVG
jgi:hypothetical protein